MAIISALNLYLQGLIDSSALIYTFGEPRAGNAEFALLIDQLFPKAFRVVSANDPVAHIPPALLANTHHSTEVSFLLWWWSEGVCVLCVCVCAQR